MLIVLSHFGRPTHFRSSSALCSCCEDSALPLLWAEVSVCGSAQLRLSRRWAVEELKLGGSSDRLVGGAFSHSVSTGW